MSSCLPILHDTQKMEVKEATMVEPIYTIDEKINAQWLIFDKIVAEAPINGNHMTIKFPFYTNQNFKKEFIKRYSTPTYELVIDYVEFIRDPITNHIKESRIKFEVKRVEPPPPPPRRVFVPSYPLKIVNKGRCLIM